MMTFVSDSYWVFSDVFEEGGILPGPFHGGFGLMTVHGTPKPAYRAFELLHGAGMQRLAVAGTCPCYKSGEYTWPNKAAETSNICNCAPLSPTGVDLEAVGAADEAAAVATVTRCTDTLDNTAGGVLATQNATTLRLFLYNHPTMSSTSGRTCEFTVQLPTAVTSAALARATLARIDEMHANPKAKFKQLGEPQYPTAAELAALETASEVVWGELKADAFLTAASAVEELAATAAEFTLKVPANGLAVVDVAL